MRLAIPVLLLLCGSAVSQPPAAPTKGKPLFPTFVVPVDPPPAPQPRPGAVPILAADAQLVIASDEPHLLFDSPRGLVTITKETGPIKIRGKFIDGNGKTETRTYAAKYVSIVTGAADAKGRVELIAVPQGLTDENKAERLVTDVNAAQPPPKPDDPVDPIDPPKPVTSFRVLFVHESGATLTQAQVSVMDAKVTRDYLNANCTKDGTLPGWRRFDKDQTAANETPTMKALWGAVKPQLTTMPCVVIEVNGKADILPFPATPAEAVALFAKYKGGK